MSENPISWRTKIAATSVFGLASALACLPLPVLHGLGASLGWLLVKGSPRLRRNIERHVVPAGQLAKPEAISIELGKGLLEISVAWRRSPQHISSLVREVHGWEHVMAAQATGQGIVWVTPHLGSYDIAGRYISRQLPVLAMYRPPKLAWLEPLMNAGRERDTGAVARADVSGVRLMLKTLKQGGSIIILPDQVPSGGDGVWAPFFGRPAYTMTLVPRLVQATQARVLMFYAERLPWGRGFRLHISPFEGTFGDDKVENAGLLNANVERLIRACPAQYLWTYRRFKKPAGVAKPESLA